MCPQALRSSGPTATKYSFLDHRAVTMISDDDLYSLAIFLGSAAMVLIVVYHYLDTNDAQAPSPATGAIEKQAAK